MKIHLILLLLISACSHQESPTDDYVLIEFASKLEEDHQKLIPPPEKKK